MFGKLKNVIETQREISKEREKMRLEEFERNTPGIKVIADAIIDAIVKPTSGVVQNMRNGVFAQYLVFTKLGMKHVVQPKSAVDIVQVIKETEYNFTFAGLGKNPLKPEQVEVFRDLIKMRLNEVDWIKASNSYVHNNCMDASLSIEKAKNAVIPETFWGNDIKI